MKQNSRLDEILNIIELNAVETQGELMELLRNRGYDVTQATVSRDIKRLNLHKSHDSNGRYRYVSDSVKAGQRDNAILSSAIKTVDYSLNNVVIKCRTGMANAACAMIDKIDNSDILGTVAGDDTILMVARSENGAKELCNYFKTFIIV